MRKNFLFVYVMTAVLLSACSLEKNTKEMKGQTDQIARQSTLLAKRTQDMERELVNQSLLISKQNLDDLFGISPINPNYNVNYEPDMLGDAKTTILSMPFQMWKGDYADDLAELDHRLDLALELMFDKSTAHIPRDFKVNVGLLKIDRSYKAVASLGAKLSVMDPTYVKALAAHGYPNLSLYDVIVMALKNRNQPARTELLPHACAQVLNWMQEAIYMLQLRQNYIPLLVMGRMTSFQDQGDIHRAFDVKTGKLQKVDLNTFAPQQLTTWIEWLEMARQTRQDLKDMGIEPQYNTTLAAFLKSTDFNQKEIAGMTDQEISAQGADRVEILQIQRHFAQLFTQIVSQEQ